jgi:hypothetical protein
MLASRDGSLDAERISPHLGLVKDKLAVVVKVDLHHADQKRLANLEPGLRQFFPEFMAKGIWVKLLKGQNSPMEEALLQQMPKLCSSWNWFMLTSKLISRLAMKQRKSK